MKKTELIKLSLMSAKKRKGTLITLVMTLLFSQLFFFFSTSIITSINQILLSKESYHIDDYIYSISPVVEKSNGELLFKPLSNKELEEISLHAPLSQVVNYRQDCFGSKINFNNRDYDAYSFVGVDVRYDSYNKKKYQKYDQNNMNFILRGRDFIADDTDSVLVNSYNYNFLPAEFQENQEIILKIRNSFDEFIELKVKIVGIFNSLYSSRFDEKYIGSNINTYDGAQFIFSSDVIKKIVEIYPENYFDNFNGLQNVELSFDELIDLINFNKSWENSNSYRIIADYLPKREYLSNLNNGFLVLLVISIILFIITLTNLINNIIIMLLEQIKTYGFFLSIGMKKKEIIALFKYQITFIFLVASSFSFLLFILTMPMCESLVKKIFGYYIKEEKFFINYFMVFTNLIGTYIILMIVSFLVVAGNLKKEIIRLMKNEN